VVLPLELRILHNASYWRSVPPSAAKGCCLDKLLGNVGHLGLELPAALPSARPEVNPLALVIDIQPSGLPGRAFQLSTPWWPAAPSDFPSQPRLGRGHGRQPAASGFRSAVARAPAVTQNQCGVTHTLSFARPWLLIHPNPSSVQPGLHINSPGLPRFCLGGATASLTFSASRVIQVLLRNTMPPLSVSCPRIRLPISRNSPTRLVWWREIPKPLTYQAQYINELPITFQRNATAQYHSDQHPAMDAVRRLSYTSTPQV
jgi:hypothetical protein